MEITKGLFGGQTPTMQQEFAGALNQFKGTTADDVANALAYSGARQLGKGLMQGFGVEDPEQKDANLMRNLAAQLQQQGINPQTPEGMVKLAEQLNAMGRADLAQQAIAVANALKKAATDEQFKQAQIRTQEAQANLYDTQAEIAGRKVKITQDSLGNVTVYDATTGELIRRDMSPLMGGGSGGSVATPGIAPPGVNKPSTTRPPLSSFKQ